MAGRRVRPLLRSTSDPIELTIGRAPGSQFGRKPSLGEQHEHVVAGRRSGCETSGPTPPNDACLALECGCVARDATLLALRSSPGDGANKAFWLSFDGFAGKLLPSCSSPGCHVGAQRDCEMKCGTTLGTVFSPDPPAIGVDDGTCDR